jgi:CsoR family transcriptional regulator, copper-sensing transcriptional repressor
MGKSINKESLKNKADLVKRLRYIEGHVRAVATMVENDAYCMDIINQSHAVIEAMKKVNSLVLEGYLGECVLDANSSNPTKRKEAVKELIKIYSKK